MTLTSERLAEIEQDPIEACLTDDEIIALIASARANAKLVEALKEARPYLVSACHFQEDARANDIIFEIDAAFKAAGVKP